MRKPIVVKVGNAQVKIYRVKVRSSRYEFFQVADFTSGKRKLVSFGTEQDARKRAQEIAVKLACGDVEALSFSGRDRNAYLRALDLLKSVDVPIELAAAEYVDARKRLAGVPLAAAVDFYIKRHSFEIKAMPVWEVVAEFIKAKEGDRLSRRYIETLRHYLGKFESAFHCEIAAISGAQIDQWLRASGLSPRSRNNMRNAVQTLFGYAKMQRYLPRDHDEIASVPVVKDGDGEIEIFTPAEMVEILNGASDQHVPFFALAGFAGVRHAEIQRLDWRDIRFDDSIIEVSAGKAKTASRRTIPLLANLREWLLPHRKTVGRVCAHRNMADAIEQLVARINKQRAKTGRQPLFAWKHNGLRHSFVSYRVAMVQNVNQVALEAGNSPQMIFRNYRELVRPSEAVAWFAIAPPSDSDATVDIDSRSGALQAQ